MSYNLLKGKRGIISGALDANSIAWKVAEKAHEEGATFTLTNAPIAMRMGEINKLAEKTGSKIIPADATSMDELKNLFTQSQEILGGKIDFVLHSIGMSANIRKNIPYPELNYDYYMKSVDVSSMSFHKMMSAAYQLDAMNEWGSVVGLSYIASQRTFSFIQIWLMRKQCLSLLHAVSVIIMASIKMFVSIPFLNLLPKQQQVVE